MTTELRDENVNSSHSKEFVIFTIKSEVFYIVLTIISQINN